MDVIIEVRDARIPFSSANPILETIGRDAGKRIVVFNKTDLADERATKVHVNQSAMYDNNRRDYKSIFGPIVRLNS